MKIIFMGTPKFSVPILEKILEKHEVVLVVTQPDTYNHRKKMDVYSPVKECAIKNNLKIFQPISIKEEKDIILNTECDLIVTSAYGQFIPEVILKHPKYNSINVHASLLPKHRGGAPIQRALINGDEKTGISIMYMEKKMDAGDIISQKELQILDSDNQDILFSRLSDLACEMILDAISDIENGKVKPIKQDEAYATFSYNLTKEDELIDFSKDARGVFNQIRGLAYNPGGYFIIDNFPLKVYNSYISKDKTTMPYGTIVGIGKDHFDISCASGSVICITEVQPPSKNIMSSRDFINGSGKKFLVVGKKVG